MSVSGEKTQEKQELASNQQGKKSQSGNSQQGPSPDKQNGKRKDPRAHHKKERRKGIVQQWCSYIFFYFNLRYIFQIRMGVPGFYSWLTRRYPMIKQMIDQQSIPEIDYLYLDMNGIIYKCVRDDSIIFKSQLMPKELEEMWIQIFNYINAIVSMLKPTKMIIMALDGVAPRCKMNNQRSRRFRSAQEYKEYIERLYGYTDMADSQENFKNNSISPGTSFMQQLNEMLHFFIQKKIEEDNYWKSLSIVFTGSDTPGEGQHKIMQFVRANQDNFLPDDTHCFYGADADLIMLGLTLPIKNACIIREEYIHTSDKVQLMSTRKAKSVNFQLIYLTILKECFDLQYQYLKDKMQIEYNIDKIARDFVFLFFFIGNDFLPRIYAYNIRQKSIEKLIEGFKDYLQNCQAYITDGPELNLTQLLRLLGEVGKFEASFFADKQLQFEKLQVQQQKNFEDELQKLFLAKIKHESNTLLGLKQMYSNEDGGAGKVNYYNTYFQIDPLTQAEQLWSILAYYVYGLKFVYQYYFQNLASWSWYYPYYFAPLLTDLQFYLGHLIAQGQPLAPFQLDQPFEPFKQLLCILPKQSADLLPEGFRKYILASDSILRNPVDFYPDVVDTVTYGSVRSHEAIYLIPFLDQSLVCQVYEREIENIPKEELKRNKLNLSTLYEYASELKPQEVKSPFVSISSFQSRSKSTQVSLLSKFEWKTMKDRQSKGTSQGEHLLKLPSLKMRPFQVLKLEGKERGLELKLMLRENQNQKFKIGEQVYYGYPLEHSGRIEGILVKNDFKFTHIELDKYDLIHREYKHVDHIDPKKQASYIYQLLKKELPHYNSINQAFYKFVDLGDTQTFLFIVQTRTFSRTIDGEFHRLFKDNHNESFTIIPACVASKERHYKTTRTIHRFKDIQEEFQVGENVLVTHWSKELCGAKGKVVGYDHNKMVKVEILEEPRYREQKIKEIIDTLSTRADIFFSLKFAAAIIGMKFDHLQTILGNISVITPKDSKLPPSIDIGLNLMSRKQHKIVPNLVRVNFHFDREKKEENPFKFIELSVRALELLIEYKQKFPEIFTFIVERHQRLIETSKKTGKSIEWDAPIYAENIYPQNSAKCIMKIYKWLVEKEETHMPACSLYSKQVNQKRIKKLKELFMSYKNKKEGKKSQKVHKNYREAKVQHIDPNFLFSHRLSQLGYLYLKKKPQNHQIGDLVICVNPDFFGHYGAIVGIDDNKYEVFFDEPSFGKSDLGGLCDNLWGGKFDFRELLNLETWPNLFSQRIKGTQEERFGWNDSIKAYQPTYKYKPFEYFKDIQVFTGKQQNKKYFTPELLEYIFKAQKDLKQVEIDKEYIIVDNRREDYAYKYDKKVTYVEKKQVEEAAQLVVTLEETSEIILAPEPIQPKEEEIFKEVEKEIIENKAEEDKNQGDVIGEEEDAEDILG